MADAPDIAPSDPPAADQSDRIKPWTIKGIPPEIRNAAIAAADREGVTIGEWFTRAVPLAILAGRRRDATPPVPVPHRADAPASEVRPDLDAIRQMVDMARDLDAIGAPPPKAVARLIYAAFRDRLSKAHRKTRPPPKSDSLSDGSSDVAPRPIAAQGDAPAIPRTEDRMT